MYIRLIVEKRVKINGRTDRFGTGDKSWLPVLVQFTWERGSHDMRVRRWTVFVLEGQAIALVRGHVSCRSERLEQCQGS